MIPSWKHLVHPARCSPPHAAYVQSGPGSARTRRAGPPRRWNTGAATPCPASGRRRRASRGSRCTSRGRRGASSPRVLLEDDLVRLPKSGTIVRRPPGRARRGCREVVVLLADNGGHRGALDDRLHLRLGRPQRASDDLPRHWIGDQRAASTARGTRSSWLSSRPAPRADHEMPARSTVARCPRRHHGRRVELLAIAAPSPRRPRRPSRLDARARLPAGAREVDASPARYGSRLAPTASREGSVKRRTRAAAATRQVTISTGAGPGRTCRADGGARGSAPAAERPRGRAPATGRQLEALVAVAQIGQARDPAPGGGHPLGGEHVRAGPRARRRRSRRREVVVGALQMGAR